MTLPVIGDPGSGWEVAGVANATADHTLIRKSVIMEGNADWDASRGTDANDSEWIVLARDDWNSVGIHPNVAPPPAFQTTDIALLPGGKTVQISSSGEPSTAYLLKSDANLQEGFMTDVAPTGGSLTTDAGGVGSVEVAFAPSALYFRMQAMLP